MGSRLSLGLLGERSVERVIRFQKVGQHNKDHAEVQVSLKVRFDL